PRPQRNNNSARFDRIEEGLEETQNNVNQLADLFQKKVFIQKCEICEETGHSKGIPPIQMVNEPRGASYKLTGDTNAISPLESSQPETYDQLLSKLSPPIRKMCLSRKAQEEETKESDDEFGGINDPAIKALGWKADKPSNFAIKGNSKHITDSLGWYTDVPVTLKDKEDKTVTVIGNFVRIDNGETEPMLFFGMSNIQKVQGSGSQGSAKRGAGPSIYDSSSLTGEKDLKKMHKLYEL
ncbi:3403_t:CDS:2, partial [Rhizophagus irregularis]